MKELSKVKTWATTLAMHAVATVVKAPITLHTADTSPQLAVHEYSKTSVEPVGVDSSLWDPPIILFYHKEFHFDGLAKSSGGRFRDVYLCLVILSSLEEC